jgi:hypothetical protein
VIAPVAAGCFSLSGTAGVSTTGSGKLSVSAEGRVGFATSLNDRTGLRYTAAPGVVYDGELAVTGMFAIDLVRYPATSGTSFRSGRRPGSSR